MKSLALEFDADQRIFTKREVSIPELVAGEILVRVTCCTICGSDLHTYCGRRKAPNHCVLGHEIIGEVVRWHDSALPQDYFGQRLKLGQRVTWASLRRCPK